MAKGRYARYLPDALTLLKVARESAFERNAKSCECADVLHAILIKLPPVLTAVLAANGLVLAIVPEISADEEEAEAELEAEQRAARLVPLSKELREALDWAESQAGEGRVSGSLLFQSIWRAVTWEFASATRRNGEMPDPLTLVFPGSETPVLNLSQKREKAAPLRVIPEAPASGAPLAKPLMDYGREMGMSAGGKLVGRERELESLISVLLKYFKPNPLLLGEAGVGKTALVEELALRIRSGCVPKALRGKRLVEVSINSLMAGTSFTGELEERLEELFRAVRNDPSVILFIDEIHSLFGGGRGGGQPGPLADVLKPALSRGDLQIIGATTNSEYQRYLAVDEAFARRFQLVQVEEPDLPVVYAILENSAPRLAEHHGVSIPDKLFGSIIRQCTEELPSRRFPDKALDVLDRACAAASIAGKNMLSEAIVEQSVADLAGLPYAHSSPEFQRRLGSLEDFLAARVVGQDDALQAVANTIRLFKHRLDPRPCRPDGVFLFLGPTGVGKTSLAHAVAEAVCGRPDALIRVDMSEFSSHTSVSRLLGADPGYVGYDSEPALVRGLLTWHSGVLLLDEFEKAHPDVQQLFLAAFDEGRIRDAKGRSHSISNLTVIATSNAAADSTRSVGFGNSDRSATASGVPREFLSAFPAELLNRFDEIVVFKPLGRPQVREILHSHLLRDLNERLAREAAVQVQVEPHIENKVLDDADFGRFGARELQRVFQRLVTQPVLRILESNSGEGDAGGISVRRIEVA